MAAKEAVGEARAPYYPEVGVETGYSRWEKHAFLPGEIIREGISNIIGPTDDWMAGLRARYTLFDSGERRAHLRAALAKQGIAEEDAARIRQDIALDVHRAFYRLVAAMETRSVAEKSLQRAEAHLRLARARYAAGAVPHADVLRAQVEVADKKLALVRAESLVRIGRGSLNTSMGLPVELPIKIEAHPEDITSPADINLNNAFDMAVRNRHELKAALQRIATAHHAVDLVKSEFGPKVRAEGRYGWRDEDFAPEDKDWLAGIFFDWPLFTGFSSVHKLDRRKAELRKEEAETERLVQNVRQEVWSTYSKLQETYEAVFAAEALVKDAEESMRSTQKRYEVGAGTITDLVDAQTALARAEATHVQAQWDYHIGRAEFRRSIGNLIAAD